MPRITAAERKAQAQRQAEINAMLRGPSMQDLMHAIAERQAQARAEFAAQMRKRADDADPMSDSTQPPKRT
jgi:hypothetical protein